MANDPSYLKEPALLVVVIQLNDYHVVFELQARLENEREHVAQRSALRERVFNALNDTGIDMPYETLKVLSVEPRNRSL